MTERAAISTPWLTYSRCTFQSHLPFVYITNQGKLKHCPCTEKTVTCHHFQTSVAIFVYKGEILWEIRFFNCLWNVDFNYDRKHNCVYSIPFWKCSNQNCRSWTWSHWLRIQEGHHRIFGDFFFSHRVPVTPRFVLCCKSCALKLHWNKRYLGFIANTSESFLRLEITQCMVPVNRNLGLTRSLLEVKRQECLSIDTYI